VSGNTAGRFGGGLLNFPGGTVTLTDSEVSGNAAGTDGGGIFNNGALTLKDAEVSGNSPNDCFGC